MTEKSAALAPPIATSGVPVRFSAPEPVFWIVKVRVTVPPGDVGAAEVGVVRGRGRRVPVDDAHRVADEIDLGGGATVPGVV